MTFRSLATRLPVLSLLLAASGCLTLDKFMSSKSGPAGGAPVSQVVTTWSNKVQFAPDPTKNGTPGPGIVGRVYLFDEQIKDTHVGDGAVFVQLFDDSGPQPGGVMIEQWYIDKDTLKRLLKRDTFGWGYTLFLPWGSYRTDLAKTHLTLRYDPEKGTPIYSQPESVSFDHGTSGHSRVATASATAPAQGPQQQLPMPRQVQ